MLALLRKSLVRASVESKTTHSKGSFCLEKAESSKRNEKGPYHLGSCPLFLHLCLHNSHDIQELWVYFRVEKIETPIALATVLQS
jgi:hypothetical protein